MKTTEYLNEISNLAKSLKEQVEELEDLNPELANRMIKVDIKKAVENMHKQLNSFSKGVHDTLQYESLKPSQVASQLRLIAAQIAASKNPQKRLIASDIKQLLRCIDVNFVDA